MQGITGAGILIIELYHGQQVCTLFGLNGKNYSDVGGSRDDGEIPIQTACRETKEETCNLITIKPTELQSLYQQNSVKMIQVKHYICYVIYINEIDARDYFYNVDIVFNQCRMSEYRESNSMARIPWGNMVTASMNNLNHAIDLNGDYVHIRKRTIDCVREFMAQYGGAPNLQPQSYNLQPIQLYKHNVTSSSFPCLVGTYTYTINPESYYNQPRHNINDINDMYNKNEYGIFIIPSDNYMNCQAYIKLCGFHKNQPSPDKFLQYISSYGTRPWIINIMSIRIKKYIYFKSKTLNNIATFLRNNNFHKVSYKWYIRGCNEVIMNNINILSDQKWDLALVMKSFNGAKIIKKYPLNML